MKPFTSLTVAVLAMFGLVHLLRLIGGWTVVVNGFEVPMWVSVVALIASWVLAAMVWRERQPSSQSLRARSASSGLLTPRPPRFRTCV